MIPHIQWVDRETAARDLLAVANQHESLDIRRSALDALRGIRSPIIANDVIKIALDTERDYWERVYALRVFADLPGNIFAPQLMNLLEVELEKRITLLKQYGIESPIESQELTIDHSVFEERFLENHPINQRWFFQKVEQVEPLVACLVYCEMCWHYIIVETVIPKLRALVEAHPQLFDLYVVNTVFSYGTDVDRAWLNGYLDRIADMCTGEDFDWIPWDWDALWEALKIKKPMLYRIYTERQARHELYGSLYKTDSDAYQQTAIWQRLESIYQNAEESAAVDYFWRVASDTSQHVIVRAAATYFLGKFYRHEHVTEKLCHLMLTADAEWEEYFEPIRYEAGEALQYSNSPQVWETMTQSFFVIRNNEIGFSMDDWYPNLTDRVCGVHAATQSLYVMESSYRRFGKLPEIEATLPDFP